jgi:hypothetical protein
MKCKVNITAPTDIAAWVSRDIFMANVDLEDLSYRESQEVYDWYHPEWFQQNSAGEMCFTPPAFTFGNGYLKGINGRHRAVLLYRHLDTIPMLLVNPETWPHGKVTEIIQKEIQEGETFDLPELQFNEAIIEHDVSDTTSAKEIFNIEINF